MDKGRVSRNRENLQAEIKGSYKMNIFQCENKAKDIGFDKAKFVALFPCGPVQCQWLDAYYGFFKADVDGLKDGFLTSGQIDAEYPDLYCSEPYVE